MAHYWRDMDPQGAAEHDKRMRTLSHLKKTASTMRLSQFTGADLPALYRVMSNKEPTDEDITQLSSSIDKYESSKKRPVKKKKS